VATQDDGDYKTRQREVTEVGTTVPLCPHLQCRYTTTGLALSDRQQLFRSLLSRKKCINLFSDVFVGLMMIEKCLF